MRHTYRILTYLNTMQWVADMAADDTILTYNTRVKAVHAAVTGCLQPRVISSPNVARGARRVAVLMSPSLKAQQFIQVVVTLVKPATKPCLELCSAK
jgi:hypothetical protein